MVNAQFKEIGPPPIPATAAREQVGTLLENVDAGNRRETVTTISGLLVWYRDLIDEELIAAWQKDGRSNLPEVIESLADAHLASAIVEFSWRRQRQTAFVPAYAPMLGHLMARYPDSAGPFLDDLLGAAPELSQPQAETVCRILLDMPDTGTWKKSALQILPHYRRVAEALLDGDIRGGDREKSYSAQRWLADLRKADAAFVGQGGTEAAAPARAASASPPAANAQNNRNVPNASRPSLRLKQGEILRPLDPALVDDTFASVNGNTPAIVDFVNRSSRSVDIYWINYQGERGPNPMRLPVGATHSAGTFLTHPFLVVVSDTGGTTAQDTGTRLAAFQAVTPNPTRDPAIRDTAIITDSGMNSSQRATPAVSGATGATLIHEYKFNGNANDSVGSSDGAMLNGAAASGGVLTLNGVNQYVQFASHIVPTAGSYSVALFAQEPTPVSSFVEFISQGRSGGPGFYIGHTPSPETIRASDSWTVTRFPGDGQWHCYVLVVDAAASQSRLFVDGIQRAALSSAIATTPNGTHTRLGRQYDPSAEYFRGSLAHVQIYSGALSDAEVVKLSASAPISTPTSQVPAPGGRGTNSSDAIQRVGNGVSAPSVLAKVDPEYSGTARKLYTEGTVLLAIVVDQAGTARDIRVIRSLGYGLDEKAIEAVGKWRFKPGAKDGNAVNVRAQVEVNFRLGVDPTGLWHSGPMAFAPEANLTPPVATDGTMPGRRAGDTTNESAVLEFTVDPGGSVKNIRSVSGSQSASDLLARSLDKWKFRPAMKANLAVEATGTVRFVKGSGDETSKLPLSPPLPQGNPSEPQSAPRRNIAETAAPNPPSLANPDESVDGTLRRLAEKDLLLQISSGKVLRFRLLAKTEFRGKDGKPVRDSLLRPGDRITVQVNPDDVETALYVIVVASGTASEREAASAPAEEGRTVAPEPSDFGQEPSAALDSPAASGKPPDRAGSVHGDVLPVGDVLIPGREVSAPVVVHRVDPSYSEEARQAKYSGTVMLSVVVDTMGRVRDIHVVGSLGKGLDEKAVEAVQKWTFKPGMKDGQAVNVRVAIGVNFRLL